MGHPTSTTPMTAHLSAQPLSSPVAVWSSWSSRTCSPSLCRCCAWPGLAVHAPRSDHRRPAAARWREPSVVDSPPRYRALDLVTRTIVRVQVGGDCRPFARAATEGVRGIVAFSPARCDPRLIRRVHVPLKLRHVAHPRTQGPHRVTVDRRIPQPHRPVEAGGGQQGAGRVDAASGIDEFGMHSSRLTLWESAQGGRPWLIR